ncbi:hypothetical protein DE146DRAFT_485722 [Phaeosphaeria sp. MPI-PUGE-AT-0046c]|nr:hypothetical protein DE146DRAFT_485722 [Phaeosphaeria sp. MPI-PUGE-AT-0046c]
MEQSHCVSRSRWRAIADLCGHRKSVQSPSVPEHATPFCRPNHRQHSLSDRHRSCDSYCSSFSLARQSVIIFCSGRWLVRSPFVILSTSIVAIFTSLRGLVGTGCGTKNLLQMERLGELSGYINHIDLIQTVLQALLWTRWIWRIVLDWLSGLALPVHSIALLGVQPTQDNSIQHSVIQTLHLGPSHCRPSGEDESNIFQPVVWACIPVTARERGCALHNTVTAPPSICV